MAWTRHQIIAVQTYRRLARLNDAEYRGLLETCAGARSSKDAGLTCHDCEVVMAHLETVLWARVDELVVPQPPSKIARNYWRNKLPKNGEPNSRLLRKMWALWDLLKPHLPETDRNNKYLAGIATHASGWHVKDIWQAKAWQVSLTIEALKDRLQHALSHDCKTAAVLGAPVSPPASAPSVPSVYSVPFPQGAGSCLHEMSEVPF